MDCEKIQTEISAFLSGELSDEETARIRKHIEGCEECSAVLDGMTCLDESLRSLSCEKMPDSLESRILGRLAGEGTPVFRRLFGSGKRALVMAGGIATILVVVGLFLFRQPSLSAAQVLADADEAKDRLASVYIRQKDLIHQNDGSVDTIYTTMWYSSPDRCKTDMNQGSASMIKVVKKGERQFYTAWNNTLYVTPLTDSVQRWEVEMLRKNFDQASGDLKTRFGMDLRVVGTEEILGRTCDVVEGKNEDFSKIRVSIDRQSGLVLGYMLYEGDRLSIENRAVDLKVNQPMADDVFIIRKPENCKVVRGESFSPVYYFDGSDELKDISAVGSELQLITEMGYHPAEKLGAVCAATSLPESYMLRGITPGTRSITIPYENITIYYLNPDTGDTVILTQSKSVLIDEGERVKGPGGVDARMIKGNVPYPYEYLIWEKDGSHFFLFASELSHEQVLEIAESLRPVEDIAGQTYAGIRCVHVYVQVEGEPSAAVVEKCAEVIQKRLEARLIYSRPEIDADEALIDFIVGADDLPLKENILTAPGRIAFVRIPNGCAVQKDAEGNNAVYDSKGIPVSAEQLLKTGTVLLTGEQANYVGTAQYDYGDMLLFEYPHESGGAIRNYLKIDTKPYLAVILDGRVLSVTRIVSNAQDTLKIGPLKKADAEALHAVMESGPLPAEVTVFTKVERIKSRD